MTRLAFWIPLAFSLTAQAYEYRATAFIHTGADFNQLMGQGKGENDWRIRLREEHSGHAVASGEHSFERTFSLATLEPRFKLELTEEDLISDDHIDGPAIDLAATLSDFIVVIAQDPQHPGSKAHHHQIIAFKRAADRGYTLIETTFQGKLLRTELDATVDWIPAPLQTQNPYDYLAIFRNSRSPEVLLGVRVERLGNSH